MPNAPADLPADIGALELTRSRFRWQQFLAEFMLDSGDGDPETSGLGAAEAQPQMSARRECRILIVDDDVSIRVAVSEFLRDEGYEVFTAANGREAIAIIERERPSLVLLDMRMPVMDGWTFARELQERDIRIPLVVMTAARDARRWAEEIHATAYVAKPFDLTELLDTFDQLCQGQQE